MYEENIENLKDSVEEAGTREALPEPLAKAQYSDRVPDTNDIINDEELLHHCRCQIADGYMHWLCDEEVYRDRLADLLEKEPFIKLETNSSLDE